MSIKDVLRLSVSHPALPPSRGRGKFISPTHFEKEPIFFERCSFEYLFNMLNDFNIAILFVLQVGGY
jgi:hypothetical protein